MNVNVEAPFNLSKEQESEIISQVKSMANYDNRITNAEVFFKMDDGNIPDGILAEVKIHVPGPIIFASDSNERAITAFSGALSKVKRQLIKAKEQLKSY